MITYGGDYGYIEAQTITGATCSASALLPNGSYAPGIVNPKVAPYGGLVNWIYPQTYTTEGIGLHTVTCRLGSLSGTAYMRFEVGS